MRIPYHRWTDVRHRAGWRLQRRIDELFRIQDARGKTRWRGPREEATENFHRFVVENELQWSRDRFIVILHGLFHSRHAMMPLARALQQSMEADAINFEYATSWAPIEQHAAALDEVLADLPPDRPVDFVGHSMGGIVIRRWFGLRHSGHSRAMHLRLGRVVMLAPPSQGSALALSLGKLPLLRKALGPAAEQLGRRWKTLDADLPKPSVPFGIVTARVPRWLLNPLLLRAADRPHDWIVRERETYLAGAADQIILPGVHAWMMKQGKTIDATAHFLQQGRFPAECQRPSLPQQETHETAQAGG